MRKITLAFYIGHGTRIDRLIRAATRSPFSHAELLEPYDGPRKRKMRAISSSPRDGGVRIKEIDFKLHRWGFLDVDPWHPRAPFDCAKQAIGQGYDWTAIAFAFAIPLRRHSPQRQTCSELCGRVLGFRHPHLISPGDLYHRIVAMNAAFQRGRLAGV